MVSWDKKTLIELNAMIVKNRTALLQSFLIGLFLLALPFLIGFLGGKTWERNLNFLVFYIIEGVGLNIILGYGGLLNLGFMAFCGCGAYCYALLCSPQFNMHWPTLSALMVSGLFSSFLGLIIGAPVLRLRDDYLALITLSFGQVFLILLNNLNHPINITNGPQGIVGIDPLAPFGFSLAKDITVGSWNISSLQLHYFLFATCAALFIVFCHFFKKSFVGRALIAIREDEQAARACGIHPYPYKLLSFCLGAFFSGIGGALFCGLQGFISPNSFNLIESFNIVAIVVLGGAGNIPGIILSCIVIIIFPECLRSFFSYFSQYWPSALEQTLDPEIIRQFVIGLAIIITATFRPNGLFEFRSPIKKGGL